VRVVQGSLTFLLADHPAHADRRPAAGGGEAKRAFEAMMTMKKIDIAAIEAARRG
jgi:predicted 3-demethylubiquinone-9 3-methyltransferase (glyoxalase superfamily)